jgi:hypothetical protein
MRDLIQQTQTFEKATPLQQKLYLSKSYVDKITHLYNVATNRGILYMETTQIPTAIELKLVKELLKSKP